MILRMPRPYKHRRTGVYYYRRVVPDDLRPIIGKGEVHVSLRTKDPREAARRCPEVAGRVDAEFIAARRGSNTEDLAREFVQHLDPSERMEVAQEIHEAHLAAAGFLDEREAPEDWEPVSTPSTQKAIRRGNRQKALDL
jgi:hypothetical protein